MSKYKWMPILRTGNFTDKNGQKILINKAELDKIIANTDLSKEPQFVIDHPGFDEVGFGTFLLSLRQLTTNLKKLSITENCLHAVLPLIRIHLNSKISPF